MNLIQIYRCPASDAITAEVYYSSWMTWKDFRLQLLNIVTVETLIFHVTRARHTTCACDVTTKGL